jgi:hypothetical protein
MAELASVMLGGFLGDVLGFCDPLLVEFTPGDIIVPPIWLMSFFFFFESSEPGVDTSPPKDFSCFLDFFEVEPGFNARPPKELIVEFFEFFFSPFFFSGFGHGFAGALPYLLLR